MPLEVVVLGVLESVLPLHHHRPAGSTRAPGAAR